MFEADGRVVGAEEEAGTLARHLCELLWALASSDGASSVLGVRRAGTVISLQRSQSPLAERGS